MNELQQRDDEIRRLLEMLESQSNTSRNREDSPYSDEIDIDIDSNLGIQQKIKDIMNEDNLSIRTRIKSAWNNSLKIKQTPEFRVYSDDELQPITTELDRVEPGLEDSWKPIQYSSELENTPKTDTMSSLQFSERDFNFKGIMSDTGSLDIRSETDFLEF